MLKPFLPQLQTTFMKALNDPNRGVRLRSADALGKLIAIHSRVDPLFLELHTAIKATDDTSLRLVNLYLFTLRPTLANPLLNSGTQVVHFERQPFSGFCVWLLLFSNRDTMLQATRFCLMGAGVSKLSDKVQRDLVQLLEGFLSSTDDSTRTAASACLGALCHRLDPDQLTPVLNQNLLGKSLNIEAV